ncbi:MAG: hypothetical protein PWR20_826 [Bacteroidales bacterium]|jgi:hypothetical protein|nr:hypothetical protein [Bacteroidales bacterium]MDN5329549.1 hypothetical protein [Bacteroidales bacterium]
MTIRHLRYNEIDKTKYDRCIQTAFNGNVYSFSWYLDVVAYGWEALVEGDYETVFPLPVKSKIGISYIFQPRFVQQLGVISSGRLDENKVEAFLRAIPSNIRYGRFNLNRHNKVKNSKQVRVSLLPNIELNLLRPLDDIRKKYSENTRRNILKAEKLGLTVSPWIKPEDIVSLFREAKGNEIKQWSDKDYRQLVHLMHTLLHRASGISYAAYTPSNELCAAAFFALSHQRSILLLSAVNEKGRQSGAMHFLIDHVIHQKTDDIQILDFEGSQNPNLARFYSSFGAETFYYPMVELNRFSKVTKTILKLLNK